MKVNQSISNMTQLISIIAISILIALICQKNAIEANNRQDEEGNWKEVELIECKELETYKVESTAIRNFTRCGSEQECGRWDHEPITTRARILSNESSDHSHLLNRVARECKLGLAKLEVTSKPCNVTPFYPAVANLTFERLFMKVSVQIKNLKVNKQSLDQVQIGIRNETIEAPVEYDGWRVGYRTYGIDYDNSIYNVRNKLLRKEDLYEGTQTELHTNIPSPSLCSVIMKRERKVIAAIWTVDQNCTLIYGNARIATLQDRDGRFVGKYKLPIASKVRANGHLAYKNWLDRKDCDVITVNSVWFTSIPRYECIQLPPSNSTSVLFRRDKKVVDNLVFEDLNESFLYIQGKKFAQAMQVLNVTSYANLDLPEQCTGFLRDNPDVICVLFGEMKHRCYIINRNQDSSVTRTFARFGYHLGPWDIPVDSEEETLDVDRANDWHTGNMCDLMSSSMEVDERTEGQRFQFRYKCKLFDNDENKTTNRMFLAFRKTDTHDIREFWKRRHHFKQANETFYVLNNTNIDTYAGAQVIEDVQTHLDCMVELSYNSTMNVAIWDSKIHRCTLDDRKQDIKLFDGNGTVIGSMDVYGYDVFPNPIRDLESVKIWIKNKECDAIHAYVSTKDMKWVYRCKNFPRFEGRVLMFKRDKSDATVLF